MYNIIIYNINILIVSKPIKDHNTNSIKFSNTDNSIKTAPDGRLIIVDESSAPLLKSGKSSFVQLLYIIFTTCQHLQMKLCI